MSHRQTLAVSSPLARSQSCNLTQLLPALLPPPDFPIALLALQTAMTVGQTRRRVLCGALLVALIAAVSRRRRAPSRRPLHSVALVHEPA